MATRLCGTLDIKVIEARNLINKDMFGLSDPYVLAWVGDARIAYTACIKNNLSPQWNEEFMGVQISADNVEYLEFEILDDDKLKSDTLGHVKINAARLITEEPISGWIPVEDPKSGETGKHGEINLYVKYTFMDSMPDNQEVPYAYFPVRKGCKLTMYQDAHQFEDSLPRIELSDGTVYKHGQCWKDLLQALQEAKHFIYITGWSVWSALVLVRDEGSQETLGDLLKRKAEEGVTVLLLVWDEKTSNYLAQNGLMMTHDEENVSVFQNSKVTYVKVARGRDKTNALLSLVGVLFTHHQKSVILDAPLLNTSKRRVVSFVGGLDLTDGRYDFAAHPLYRTLQTYHKNDFHQSSVVVVKNESVTVETGPREPWHDIHGKIEGPAARDVLTNFVERWRKQADNKIGLLLNIEGHPDIISIQEEEQLYVNNHDTWSVQLFRSIDARSAEFSRSTVNLATKKGRAVDATIHAAYVHSIRRAKRFIYIENQYFLGSSHAWEVPHKGAVHLIPLEIANKICDKIRRRERFTAYVVIPMYPEGDPTSTSVQQILYWQWCTIKMMYDKVANALRKANLNHHPREYLMFYCLGSRESPVGSQQSCSTMPPGIPAQLNSSRRFMIYVHSKMLIVDDEYIMIGSANINQRSMIGTRDSEIAFGAWQPRHLAQNGKPLTSSQVHGFRMALWAEHLGYLDPLTTDPADPECAKLMMRRSDENWQLYSGAEVVDLSGHLLAYPYNISVNGTVDPLLHAQDFPDTQAAVTPRRPSGLMRQLAKLTM